MKNITLPEAEQTVIDLLKEENINLTCFLFYETHCPMCNEFLTSIVPWIEEQGITVYGVNLTENFMPFPPGSTPTTYWYILKDRPPMVKKGLPPHIDMLKTEVEKMLSVNKGLTSVEETFF